MQPVPPTTFINYRCIPQAKRRFSILKYDTSASMTSIQAFALQKGPQLMISIANSQNSKTLRSQVALSETKPPPRQVLPCIEYQKKYRIDQIDKKCLPSHRRSYSRSQASIQGVLTKQRIGEVSDLLHQATRRWIRYCSVENICKHQDRRRCQAGHVFERVVKDRSKIPVIKLIIAMHWCPRQVLEEESFVGFGSLTVSNLTIHIITCK